MRLARKIHLIANESQQATRSPLASHGAASRTGHSFAVKCDSVAGGFASTTNEGFGPSVGATGSRAFGLSLSATQSQQGRLALYLDSNCNTEPFARTRGSVLNRSLQ